MSTAFGCTIQGRVDPAEVLRLVQRRCWTPGVERVGLADTVGYADPAAGGAPVRAGLRVAGDRLACGHFHDTRGLGLANVYAAWQVGVRRFDACLGGIGGCPHAPGRQRQRRHRGPGLPDGQHGRAHRPGLSARCSRCAARLAGWLDGEPLHGTHLARRPCPRRCAGHRMTRSRHNRPDDQAARPPCPWPACAWSSSPTW
jgi:hydroxymethylglutaryl-CoA lyase